MSSSVELLSFDIDCNIDGANVLLRATNGVAVRRDTGANEDTKDAIARKQISGFIIVRIMREIMGDGCVDGGAEPLGGTITEELNSYT